MAVTTQTARAQPESLGGACADTPKTTSIGHHRAGISASAIADNNPTRLTMTQTLCPYALTPLVSGESNDEHILPWSGVPPASRFAR